MRKVGKVLATCMAIAGSIVAGYIFFVTLLSLYIAKSEDAFDDALVDGFNAYLGDDINN